MATASVDKNLIDKYFNMLQNLSVEARKMLVKRLNRSIETETKKSKPKKVDIIKLAGSWEDERDSDEIIRDIYNSRVNAPKREEF